jgi:hypothetical protein
VPLDLSGFEALEWDDERDENGNWAHCSRADHLGSNPERIVSEVLSEEPVEFTMEVRTAAFAVVGPDGSRSTFWVVLLDVSSRRGDFLRPVTGWQAGPKAMAAWREGRRSGGMDAVWLT